MQLLHPFMPFITEEIYHRLKDRNEDLVVKQFAPPKKCDKQILQHASLLKEVITSIRDTRVKAQLKPKDTIRLHVLSEDDTTYKTFETILAKQVNAATIVYTNNPVSDTMAVVVQKDKLFIESSVKLDTASQKEQLLKDLDYQKGFLLAVEKKLGNERFVQNAKPEVVAIEQKKKADAEAKIKAIEESLASL